MLNYLELTLTSLCETELPWPPSQSRGASQSAPSISPQGSKALDTRKGSSGPWSRQYPVLTTP